MYEAVSCVVVFVSGPPHAVSNVVARIKAVPAARRNFGYRLFIVILRVGVRVLLFERTHNGRLDIERPLFGVVRVA